MISPTTMSNQTQTIAVTLLVTLSVVAGFAALGGANSASSIDHGNWSMYSANAHNTGNLNTTGPTNSAAEDWKSSVDSKVLTTPLTVDVSPYVNQTVYVGTQDSLYALDAGSGKVRWNISKGSKDAPAVVDIAANENKTVFYHDHFGNLYALDAVTGKQICQFQLNTSGDKVKTAVTVFQGTVYVGIKNFRTGKVQALDPVMCTSIWSSEFDGRVPRAPAVVGADETIYDTPTVYVPSHEDIPHSTVISGTMTALNATTGEMRWKFGARRNVKTAPAVANGNVYFAAGPYVWAVNATTGLPEWDGRTKVAKPVEVSPAVANGSVYVATNSGLPNPNNSVYRLDAMTGDIEWRTKTGGHGVFAAPAVVQNTVYVGVHDSHELVALNTHNGSERWSYETNGSVGPPSVLDGTVYFGSGDEHVYALVEG